MFCPPLVINSKALLKVAIGEISEPSFSSFPFSESTYMTVISLAYIENRLKKLLKKLAQIQVIKIILFSFYIHSFRFAQGTKLNEMSWLRAAFFINL